MTEVPRVNPRDHQEGLTLPRLPSIPALFEAIAAANADSTALSFGSASLTYAELNQRANRLAHRMMKLGASKGKIVGLWMERSLDFYIGMLAILKTGAAYLPLDGDSPTSRFSHMLRETKADIVLVHEATASRVGNLPSTTVSIQVDHPAELAKVSGQLVSRPDIDVNCDDLAYVMYTSGSTGTPKGVLIPHRGVVRLVRETNYCEFGRSEVFLQLAPVSFDASTFEIWGALLNGGRLAILPPGSVSLSGIAAAIHDQKVTTLWLTSGLFHLMVEQRPDDLKGLRQLLAGGDVLSPSHVRKALSLLEHGVVINGYGPTESTTFAACYRMSSLEQAEDRIPIGLPICKTTLHVLNENFAPLPDGQVGELWIGGQGVALGYLNDPELTKRKFIPDPFSKNSSSRLYRTGDLARKRPDGIYEFLGRVDDQVKILGHRIEPSEIEQALLRHLNVREAMVIPLEDSRGQKRLVGYVVSDQPINDWRSLLAKHLPTAMIPSALIYIAAFPLTPNGKVDREALARLDRPSPNVIPNDDRGGDVDPRITEIWEKALSVKVGPDDNFFDLGGDSLLLIEIHGELQKALGREIPIMDLFEFPTTRSIDGRLSKEKPTKPRFDETKDRAARQKEAMARNKALRTTSVHD